MVPTPGDILARLPTPRASSISLAWPGCDLSNAHARQGSGDQTGPYWGFAAKRRLGPLQVRRRYGSVCLPPSGDRG